MYISSTFWAQNLGPFARNSRVLCRFTTFLCVALWEGYPWNPAVLGSHGKGLRASLVAPSERGEGSAHPVLIPWFWLIVLVQWFWCSCPAVAGFYSSWATGAGTRDASEANCVFHQGEWGSYCWDQSIFLGCSLCSCHSLFYRRFLFVICGSHGLVSEHSANLCSWCMGICWFFNFFFSLNGFVGLEIFL